MLEIAQQSIPTQTATAPGAAGVNLLPDLSDDTAAEIAGEVAHVRQPGDVIIASIHWGGNWGYEIPEEQQRFAHALIDRANVSLVYGHSSHHPKAIEIYKNRLILYGCGDFLNDYEGISGYEEFRGDLVLMYFPSFDSSTAHLIDLELVPLQIRRFQLIPASPADIQWMQRTLSRESEQFDARISFGLKTDGRLTLFWPETIERSSSYPGDHQHG